MDDTDEAYGSAEATFRFHVVGMIRAHQVRGGRVAQAVAQLADQVLVDLRGKERRLSARTLYRWLAAYEQGGLRGLEPQARPRITGSGVLPEELLDFCLREKEDDPEASIPDLLERAVALGVIPADLPIDRSTVWRALVRRGVSVTRAQRQAETDMRPYAFAHRMQQVLADGKHFRAGRAHLKRVALLYVDDATRRGLNVVVGTSEQSELFLRGLFETVETYGLMNTLYLDGGPGFIADDTWYVCTRLRVTLIHGRRRYPEGHGKVEAFVKTIWRKVLRSLVRRPDVDPDPRALELRLKRALLEVYNHRPHEGIDGQTPADSWAQDTRPLTPIDRDTLRRSFRRTLTRRARKDNVVSYQGTRYELPVGHAGAQVRLVRRLLEPEVLYLPGKDKADGDKLIRLHPVDVHANASSRRAPRGTTRPPDSEVQPRRTASDIRFDSEFSPIVEPDGGYRGPSDRDPEDDS